MSYASEEARRAYIQGAKDGVASLSVGADPAEFRAAEEWIAELEGWSGGDPPPGPDRRDGEDV